MDDLERIGIDEISWRRGQCYLTLVVDHVTGRLDWATEGRSKKVVESFFAQLGQQRCAQLTHVSSDGAEWILGPVEQHCTNASICLDPFHLVQWANSALDKVRRAIWNQTRRSGQKTQACSGGLQGRVSQRGESTSLSVVRRQPCGRSGVGGPEPGTSQAQTYSSSVFVPDGGVSNV